MDLGTLFVVGIPSSKEWEEYEGSPLRFFSWERRIHITFPFHPPTEFPTSRWTVVYFEDEPVLHLENLFELASWCRPPTFEDVFWGFFGTPRDFFASTTPLTRLPDVFNGPETLTRDIEALGERDSRALNLLILEGVDHLRSFLRAGYHEKKNLKPVDSWVLQVDSMWISLLTSLFQIRPGFPDSTLDRELYESAQMRHLVTSRTQCVLANYLVNILQWEDWIREEGGRTSPWNNLKFWEAVRIKLRNDGS